MDRFAIDLLWVRVGKVGGSESFIRNLISGFMESDRNFEITLVAATDNADSFHKYTIDKRIKLLTCPVNSENVKQRIAFQNFKLSKILRNRGVHKCLEPVYSMPFIGTKKIEYYTVIHDLQALHYHEYFSIVKRLWLMASWKHAIRCSEKVITISNYTKNDIIRHLGAKESNIEMIYNPVVVRTIESSRALEVVRKYGVEPEEYFFCVTSMMPHKNIDVLIDIMGKRTDNYKLLICGVGGKEQEKFIKQIESKMLENKIIVTPFVTDEERDSFYQECKLFLFPSVFEGFGMPPVEALLKDKPVITTKCTSIPEVTAGEAEYVDNPRDYAEWNSYIDLILGETSNDTHNHRKISSKSNPYSKAGSADKYLTLIIGGDE